MMRVFLFGKDHVGWVMDHEYKHTEIFLQKLGYTLTSNFLTADVIQSVWWNSLLSLKGLKSYILRWKKVIAYATNEIDVNGHEFQKAKRFVNLWIAPSNMMLQRLKQAGVDVKYQPFYADERIFHKVDKSKDEIAQELGINYKQISDKFVIGSFQRDSLGADLSKPKWQKGADLLVEILRKLPKDNFILLLAGPRRHWIINQCKKLGIPYLYYGEEPKELNDDIQQNTLNQQIITKLLNLTDLYIVSSKSEGGPKAILESAFTETMILSTDVGLAPDFLDPWCIYRTVDEGIQKTKEILGGKDVSEIVRFNYEKVYDIASYKPMLYRWEKIYEYFKSVYL